MVLLDISQPLIGRLGMHHVLQAVAIAYSGRPVGR
jgi:hypothetical protein